MYDKPTQGQSDVPKVGPAPIARIYRPVRPLGITVIAIFNFVLSALLIVVIALSVSNASTGDYSVACIYLLPVVISVGLGIGLWRMLSWARNTAIVLYGVEGLTALLNAFSTPITYTSVLSFLIPIGIIVYLLQPGVKAAFEGNT